MNQPTSIIGYMHIIVETIKVDEAQEPIHAHISIGELAKVDSVAHLSGSVFNETFLL